MKKEFKIIIIVVVEIFFSCISYANDLKKISFSDVIKKVAPSVVSIYASNTVISNKNLLDKKSVYNHLFGNDSDNSYSIGSGVVINSKGLIVTNAHVIKGKNNIDIVLNDGRQYKATIIAINNIIDLGLLKINDTNSFQYLNLYDENSSEVGDVVLAIGNPFGIGQTVTLGMISGFRYFDSSNDIGFGKLIQIDAEINPGNSGGALINTEGKLIGINSAIYSLQNRSFSNIGFSIPTSVVKLFVSRALSGSNIKKYWIGLTGISVDMNLVKQLNIVYPKGVLVMNLYPGGPADLGGIKKNDIILKINDTDINNISDLSFFVAKIDSDEKLNITILRNNKIIKLIVVPDIPIEKPKKDIYEIDKGVLSGVTVVNNSPAVSYEINTNSMASGVVIYDISNTSLLSKLGIRIGDFLSKIDDVDLKSTEDLKNYLDSHNQKNSFKLEFKRNDESINLNINHNGF